MILMLLLAPFFGIVTTIISLLPNNAFEGVDIAGFVNMFATAFQFFPPDVWILCIGCITFWVTVHLIFAIFNFIVKMLLGGLTL